MLFELLRTLLAEVGEVVSALSSLAVGRRKERILGRDSLEFRVALRATAIKGHLTVDLDLDPSGLVDPEKIVQVGVADSKFATKP